MAHDDVISLVLESTTIITTTRARAAIPLPFKDLILTLYPPYIQCVGAFDTGIQHVAFYYDPSFLSLFLTWKVSNRRCLLLFA